MAKVKWETATLLGKMDTFFTSGLRQIAEDIIDDIKDSMENTEIDPSKKYRSKTGYGYHHPSVAGYPPNPDTTRLMNSFSYMISSSRGRKNVIISTTSEYAPLLEFGTGEIAPRPFMTPAFERAKPFMLEKFIVKG